MEKDKFQPIVMPCTKEQYDSLLPVLEKNEIDIARNNDNCPYSKRITNYFAIYNNFVSRTYVPDSIFEKDRPEVKIYKRFNRKIFLKSLGIVEEPEFVLPIKWFVIYANYEEFNIINKHFKKGWSHIKSVNKNGYFSGNDKYGNNWLATPGNSPYGKKSLLKKGYVEITFEQFKKYVLKQDISISESQSKVSELKLTDVCVSLYQRPTEHLKDFYDFLIKNNQNLYVETFNEFLNYRFSPINGPYFGLALGENNEWMGINNKRKLISISEIKKLILKSQSITNKQPKTMLKATIEETQPKEKIHKGCLVKWKDVIGVVTSSTNHKTVNITSLSRSAGQAYSINMEIDNVSLFKGKLTLEQ